MFIASDASHITRARRWTGLGISGIAVLFLGFDILGKLLRVAPVVEGTAQLGFPETAILPIGALLLVCTAAYLIPRTAILGAVLLTGYMGGAVAAHLRIGSPLLTHVMFPVYVSVFVWGGLFLRDSRVRDVVGPAS